MAEYDNTAADIKEIDSIDTESTSARLISPPGLSPFLQEIMALHVFHMPMISCSLTKLF